MQKCCKNPIKKSKELLEACWYFSKFSLEFFQHQLGDMERLFMVGRRQVSSLHMFHSFDNIIIM